LLLSEEPAVLSAEPSVAAGAEALLLSIELLLADLLSLPPEQPAKAAKLIAAVHKSAKVFFIRTPFVME